MKKNIYTIYSPLELDSNSYVKIIKRILNSQNISTYNIRDVIFPSKIRKIKIANFNWLENRVNRNSAFEAWRNVLINIVLITYLKMFGVRIVYTFHNRLPHNCKQPRINIFFIKWLCKHSDKIVILSDDSEKILLGYFKKGNFKNRNLIDKIQKIPHPSYYEECKNAIRPLEKNSDAVFKITFVGSVSKYKNVELIIKTAEALQNLPIEFYIAGGAKKDYAEELEKRAENISNLKLNLNFLPDEELYQTIINSSILLLPYDKTSSLNSGTLYLAFTLGRNVICPEIGTVHEFPSDLIYHYDYHNEKEHLRQIKKQVLKAFQDYTDSFSTFQKKADELQRIVNNESSEAELGRQYRELYDELCK